MRLLLFTGLPRRLRYASGKKFSTFSYLRQSDRALQKSVWRGTLPEAGSTISVATGIPRPSKRVPLEGRKASALRGNNVAKPDPFWLRDSCGCDLCVDPSSKQKRFQTTDIPLDIECFTQDSYQDGSLKVTWSNDIPGYDGRHVSAYSKEFLERHQKPSPEKIAADIDWPAVLWNKAVMSNHIKFIEFDSYMSEDSVLFEVLAQLRTFGLVLIRGVPESEVAVEDIGRRIGNLKDTLYGRTWNVKSVPNAKNVAYTHQYLGLHMDLLYTDHPPALQLLHCLKNSCEGGSSLFSDSFYATSQVKKADPDLFQSLQKNMTTFHYDNAGEYYRARRPTIKMKKDSPGTIDVVNWSPPFQGPFIVDNGISDFRSYVMAMKAFAAHIEAPENIYEYRMQEGECVIFSNRRVLHARRAFDISSGERWLKGAYLDRDVFMSRFEVMRRTYRGGK